MSAFGVRADISIPVLSVYGDDLGTLADHAAVLRPYSRYLEVQAPTIGIEAPILSPGY